jgi:octaprenyl-diphosphate synthase
VAFQRDLSETVTPINEISAMVQGDMQQLDDCIRERLQSDVALINQISEYIIYSGGKRIRPLLLILSTRACGYSGNAHILLSAIIEFIHTATLLHDDVVDESALRRGQKTAHSVWGNAASVLVGDFLYSRSFQMMVDLKSMRIMQILAETTNTIAEGEVLQLLNLKQPDVDERSYMHVIENKTARLFAAACQLGAVIARQTADIEQALHRFGTMLGCVFQIADDILDYDADAQTMGKNIGDDLAEGKPTLPLIYARDLCSAAGREVIDQAVRDGDVSRLDDVMEIIHGCGAMDKARQKAEEIAAGARLVLKPLPASEHRDALASLCHFAIDRDG